jgi:MFS family permease
MAQGASRLEIGLLYVAGVIQGLALVTFPAASAIFTSPTGFALSGTQYGLMFIPQVVLAILASALGPALALRVGLRGVLVVGLCGDLVAMALLAVSPLLMGAPSAFFLLCVATGALGLGFGAAAERVLERRAATAATASGGALSPAAPAPAPPAR